MDFQSKIISEIKNKYPNQLLKTIQRDIAKLLETNAMTAYNKLTNRSSFSIDEICKIAQHYNISLDNLLTIKNDHLVNFNVTGIADRVTSFEDYVDWLLNIQKQLTQNAAIDEICFLLNQPSLFHLARYPYLIYLKLYSYNLIKWDIPAERSFDPSRFVYDKTISQKLDTIHQRFSALNRIDVLSGLFIDKITDQIKYLIKSDHIRDNTVISRYREEVEQLISDLEFQFSQSPSPSDPKVDVYLNRFVSVSNITLIKYETGYFFSIQADVPDVLLTNHITLGNHFHDWIRNIIDNSTKISTTGTIERKAWLDKMRENVALSFT